MTANDNSKKAPLLFAESISGSDFVRFLTAKTLDKDCVICGHADFALLCQPDTADMLELRLPTAFGSTPEPIGWYGLAYTCKNCGHLFTVSKQIVANWLLTNT